MSKTLSVLILGLILLSSCLEAYNNILHQLQFTSEQSSGIISRCRPLFLLSQPVLSHSNYRNLILRSTDDSVEDPGRERAVKKSKRKARETSEMMRFGEEIVKPWSLSDSFNSTTMKFIFGLKVDRDIKLTFKTGDIIKRKIKKETKIIFSGVSEVSKPFLALPAAVQKLSDQKDLWGLVRVGVNPLSEERMLDNFNAKNTKERARLPKKKAVPMLAADSVYRTVRMLPNKLKYDYERKKIAEGIKKNEIESRRENLLSDGSDDYDEDDVMSGGGRRGGGGRIPLLPDTIYSQGQASDSNNNKNNRKRKRNSDEDSDFINYDNMGSSTYNTADGIIDSYDDSDIDSKYNKNNDGYERLQRGMTMTITEEDAAASISLIQALRSFSQDVVETGLLLKLKEELLWAVGVAQETLDLEILEAGKRRVMKVATPQEIKVKEEMKDGEEEIEIDKRRDEAFLEDNNTQDTDEDEDELRRWGIERLISSKNTISNAIGICSRLEDLPLQLKSIVKDKGREKVLRLRVGDIEGLRRGVEAFVGGIPTAATTDSDSGSDSDSGNSSKNDVGSVSGWGGGQAGVVERIVGNRPLLAGVYGISNGLEETLNEQRNRMEQREYDGQSSVGSREDRSRGGGWRSAGVEWDSEQSEQSGQDDSVQRDDEIEVKGKGDDESESVPEGLVKETIRRSDDSALGEGEGDPENKGGRMAGKDTRDIPIKATPSPLPPSPPMWSPGAAVMPVSFSQTPPPIATVTTTVTATTAADISSQQQQDENITPDISIVVEIRDNEDGNANAYRSTLNKTTDGDKREVVEQTKEVKGEAKEVKEELGDDSISKDDDDDEGEVYFLSVIDDDNKNDNTYSRTRVNKSYSSSSRGDDGSGQRDSSVFDTTIESTRDKDADQIILFLTTSLDVMFFLLETIAKASGPILLGGGAVAAERASEALFADVISPKSFLRKNNRSDNNKDRDKGKGSNVGTETLDSSSSSAKESSVKTWKLLSEFKQQI